MKPTPSQAIAIVEMIDQLRADEGDSIEILCDNPDPRRVGDSVAVECRGEWCCSTEDQWEKGVRFYGTNLENALRNAYQVRSAAEL